MNKFKAIPFPAFNSVEMLAVSNIKLKTCGVLLQLESIQFVFVVQIYFDDAIKPKNIT